MATIKDVAAQAGVSHATVSHVLNETRPVLPETRARVVEAIRALGYVPSAVARSLKQKVTDTIGLIVPNSTNPYFAELARGIEDACFRQGRSLVLCSSDEDPERQEAYVRLLREKRVDGIIVASLSDEPRWVAALQGASAPLVVVDRKIAGLTADLVECDHQQGGRLAAEHLLSLGHQRVACVAAACYLGVVRDRTAGFRGALQAAGVELPEAAVADGGLTASGGRAAALQLLRASPRPTALFAMNDLMAIGALRAIAELGLRAPADVSVLGFDDVELGRYCYPALSTIAQPIHEMGSATVELLLGRSSRPGRAPRRVTLAPRLVIRESTGPAHGRARKERR